MQKASTQSQFKRPIKLIRETIFYLKWKLTLKKEPGGYAYSDGMNP